MKSNIKKYLKEKKVNEVIKFASDEDVQNDKVASVMTDALNDKNVQRAIAKDLRSYIEKTGILDSPTMEGEITNSIWEYGKKNGIAKEFPEAWDDMWTEVVFAFVAQLESEMFKSIPKIIEIAAKNKDNMHKR